ncbi:efflux RND transporter periplasmic adaptor subunit [Variovorax sp. PCZ-1]|uniref:efflux RND transporter periplasmic adaptor subunit n=1 Tax=Variovorax sp. PCZ-1 TaxID=2835533 RepID=UPI001BCAF6C3|nr:efflux RND transporter periplasmic adaptor subunit [Variovorax sp. PCZ-1]MBS7807542.1 efflux RND transporter periplasmic adaptor subunit [Variovorax sp. PCZ-1]
MKSSTKWIIGALALLLIAGGAARVLAKRQATPPPVSTAKVEPVIELTAGDVFTLQNIELSQGVPISGSLKAVNSALVKARVSGELQGLVVREGDAVKAGQVIARVDSSEYAARVRQAQETADAAQAQISIAQRSFDNNKALVDQGFISRTALDTSQASLQSAQANHKAALAALDVAKKSVQDTVLVAPITGIISQRLAQPGERVGIDARVVEIVDLSRLELEAPLAASDSVQVRVGQTARLKLEGRSEEIAATVTRINPSASASNRSVLVYLSVAALPGLRQGLFAQGTLDTVKETVLAVPLSAVRTDKPQPYVQLIQNGRIAHQTVELGGRGEAQGMTMVAIKNIAAGAMITPASAGNLRENTKISLPGSKAATPAKTAVAGTTSQ